MASNHEQASSAAPKLVGAGALLLLPSGGFAVALFLVVVMFVMGFGNSAQQAAQDDCPDTGTDAQVVAGGTNVDTAMKTLMKTFELTAQQAGGLVGNWQVEAGPNVDPKSRNSLGYQGIVQWDPSIRWPQLERFAAAKKLKPLQLEAQLRFVGWELGWDTSWTDAGKRGGYANIGKQVKAAGSADEAAKVIFDKYEIPGDGSLPKRQKYARALAKKYSGDTTVVAARQPAAPAAGDMQLVAARRAPDTTGGGVGTQSLEERLRKAAKWARANGWTVSEFAQEGTNHPGLHMPGSDHNRGWAFDANRGRPGNNSPEEVKHWPALRDYLKSIDLGAIYGNKSDHLDHVHVMPPGRPHDAVKSGGKANPAQPAGGSDECADTVNAGDGDGKAPKGFQSTLKSFAYPDNVSDGRLKPTKGYAAAVARARKENRFVGHQANEPRGRPVGIHCSGFMSLLMTTSGFDSTYNHGGRISDGAGFVDTQQAWMKKHWKSLGKGSSLKVSDLKPGDVGISNGAGFFHVWVYIGKVPGLKGNFAEASYKYEGKQGFAPQARQSSKVLYANKPDTTYYRKKA